MIDSLVHEIEVASLANGFSTGNFYRLDSANGFKQMALLPCSGDQLLLCATSKGCECTGACNCIQGNRKQRDQRELPTVQQHHSQRHHRHKPVNERFYETDCQRLLNELDASHS
ncbi:hypothetical protein D3C71_1678860 [compost metagenome]